MMLYAFDGTGNSERKPEARTLVHTAAIDYHNRCVLGSEGGASGQLAGESSRLTGSARSLYLRGVGTRFGPIGLVAGGVSGVGAKRRVRIAYQRVCEIYASESSGADELMIDIVGFSRGGATALHFANVLFNRGIRQPRPVSWWRIGNFNSWRPYRRGLGWILFRDWKPLDAPSEVARRVNDTVGPKQVIAIPPEKPWTVIPRIRFLGLWDAVGSFGLPLDTRLFDLQTMPFGFQLETPPNVLRCSHAMALDERRKTFRNVRVSEGTNVAFKKANASHRAASFAKGLVWLLAIWAAGAIFGDWSGLPQTLLVMAACLIVGGMTMHIAAQDRVVAQATNQAETGTSPHAQAGADNQSWLVNGAPGSSIGYGVTAALLVMAAAFKWGLDRDVPGSIVWLVAAAMASTILLWPAVHLALRVEAPPLTAEVVRKDRTARFTASAVVLAYGLLTLRIALGVVDRWPKLANSHGLFFAYLAVVTVAFVAAERNERPDSKLPMLATMFVVGVLAAVALSDASTFATSGTGSWIIASIGLVFAALMVSRLFEGLGAQPDRHAALTEWKGEIIELWFRGNHTDIGGGGTPRLVETSRHWMNIEAATVGLVLRDPVESTRGRDAVIEAPPVISAKSDLFVSKPFRFILEGDCLHDSVVLHEGDPKQETLRRRLWFRLEHLSVSRSYFPRILSLRPDVDESGRRRLAEHIPEVMRAAAEGTEDAERFVSRLRG